MHRYIYGFGGISLELAELLAAKGEGISGFVVDKEYLSSCGDERVISFDDYISCTESSITIALGEPAYREKLSKRLAGLGLTESSIILGDYVSESASIGAGSIVHLGAVVSSNCSVGKCCLINKRVILGHDSTIGDYSVMSPNAITGGHVSIGNRCFVGLGACIRDRVRIGDDVIVGMGSVVTHDIEDGVVVYGNPARVMRRNDAHKVFGAGRLASV